MSNTNAKDRRGDRRQTTQVCQATRPVRRGDPASGWQHCGSALHAYTIQGRGTVLVCTVCNTVDRRSLEARRTYVSPKAEASAVESSVVLRRRLDDSDIRTAAAEARLETLEELEDRLSSRLAALEGLDARVEELESGIHGPTAAEVAAAGHGVLSSLETLAGRVVRLEELLEAPRVAELELRIAELESVNQERRLEALEELARKGFPNDVGLRPEGGSRGH